MSAAVLQPSSSSIRRVAANAIKYCRRNRSTLASLSDRQPVIVSFARTAIGRFNGALAPVSATRLGAAAVKGAFERAGLSLEADGKKVDEIFLGNVVAAGVGQAPATQAAVFAGLPKSIPSTTINKVCASGMKSIMLAADAIALGRAEIVIAGGFESMSNIPHFLPTLRNGVKLGETKIVDGLVHDGLWDVYNNMHMGSCAELCAAKYNFDRAAQDAFALHSYEKALSKAAKDMAASQIVPVQVTSGKTTVTVKEDEEPGASKLDKMSSLKPAFQKDGTVTAANASKLNDGAAAVVVMSAAEAKKRGVKPLAAIRSFADAQQEPEWFTTTPALAVPKAIAAAGLVASDLTVHEINEAFSVVALANAQILGLNLNSVNIHGGAVALGHPIGCSGARIVGQLAEIMQLRGDTFGSASICNGGGGASAIVLELLA